MGIKAQAEEDLTGYTEIPAAPAGAPATAPSASDEIRRVDHNRKVKVAKDRKDQAALAYKQSVNDEKNGLALQLRVSMQRTAPIRLARLLHKNKIDGRDDLHDGAADTSVQHPLQHPP